MATADEDAAASIQRQCAQPDYQRWLKLIKGLYLVNGVIGPYVEHILQDWEVAKTFLDRVPQGKSSIADVDPYYLLKLMKNCKQFVNLHGMVDKVLVTRNILACSSHVDIKDDNEMESRMEQMVELVRLLPGNKQTRRTAVEIQTIIDMECIEIDQALYKNMMDMRQTVEEEKQASNTELDNCRQITAQSRSQEQPSMLDVLVELGVQLAIQVKEDTTGWIGLVGQGAVVLTEKATTDTVGWIGNAGQAAVNWTGQTAKDSVAWTGQTTKDSVAWTAQTAKDYVAWTGQTAKDSVAWTGQTATDSVAWTGQTAKDSVAWTGHTAKDAANWTEQAGKDAVVWTGNAGKDAMNWTGNAGKDMGNFFKKLF